jgi:hypothetical protein
VVRSRDRVAADNRRPLVLYESGFAPRWYVPRADIDESVLTRVQGQTTSRCTRSSTPGCDGRVPLPDRAGKLSEGQDC